LTDITELRVELETVEQRAAEASRAVNFLYTLLNQLPMAVKLETNDGKILFANELETELSRNTRAPPEAANTSGSAVRSTASAGAETRMATSTVETTEDRVVGLGGERTFLQICKPARVSDTSLLLTASFDITERKRVETELSKRAYFDDLTGLPNRSLIQEHVELLLVGADKPSRFALAFLDVDNFKHINDYYTHAIGDALLVKVAQRISSNIRPTDILARISGDEFLLVISPSDNDDELTNLIGTLLQQLKEPFLIEGYEILTSASIGLSVYPDHGLNYEMLRRAADNAMYRVKAGTKGGAVLFDADMGRAMTARMAQEQRLRLAVRDGRFCCAFQPKVDIRSQEIVGVEALIRLRDEDGIIQAPGEFIGLATELGLIDDLTYLALGEIVGSFDLIDEAFGPATSISINIAAKQAGDLKFMRALCEELSATSSANRFILEVTEDAFLARNLFQTHVVPMLREIGTRVSIDDFGTGYHLCRRLPTLPRTRSRSTALSSPTSAIAPGVKAF
jgi:c-di-GMP phosphodiesterase Gmr